MHAKSKANTNFSLQFLVLADDYTENLTRAPLHSEHFFIIRHGYQTQIKKFTLHFEFNSRFLVHVAIII